MITEEKWLEACKQLKTPNISKMLRDFGWSLINYPNDRAYLSLQKIINGELEQIDVPNNPDYPDYADLMLSACKKYAAISKQTVSETISRFLNPMSDVILFRKTGPTILNGTIPIEEAVPFFESSKKALGSAAMDIISPRQYRRKMKLSDDVAGFVDLCRFGQTEFGSYVISLVCPLQDYSDVNNQYVQLSLFGDNYAASNCFTRKVVNKMINSIQLIKSTIDHGDDLDVIMDPSSQSFVSGNFMENILNLEGDSQLSSLDVDVKWSPMATDNRASAKSISLSSIYHDVLNEKVASLRNKADDEIMDIVGPIIDLKGAGMIAQREKTGGTITVAFIRQGTKQAATIQASLSYSNYQEAVEAHRMGKTVKLSGKVLPNGKMSDPDFSII